jgi:hypothetical protein
MFPINDSYVSLANTVIGLASFLLMYRMSPFYPKSSSSSKKTHSMKKISLTERLFPSLHAYWTAYKIVRDVDFSALLKKI